MSRRILDEMSEGEVRGKGRSWMEKDCVRWMNERVRNQEISFFFQGKQISIKPRRKADPPNNDPPPAKRTRSLRKLKTSI